MSIEKFDNLKEIFDSSASRMKFIRAKSGLSQAQFANKIGLQTHKIRDIETGKVNISVEIALLLEEFFDVSFKWLLTGAGSVYINDEKGGVDAGKGVDAGEAHIYNDGKNGKSGVGGKGVLGNGVLLGTLPTAASADSSNPKIEKIVQMVKDMDDEDIGYIQKLCEEKVKDLKIRRQMESQLLQMSLKINGLIKGETK